MKKAPKWLGAFFMMGAFTFVTFLFTARPLHGSLPLTWTINTIPEGEVELLFRGELIEISGKDYRVEKYSIGLGALPELSLWYSFHYLHDSRYDSERSELGDSFLTVWFYLGDFFDSVMQGGLMTTFRFPTGRNAYEDEYWRNLSYGNNELRIGPVLQLDVFRLFFHLNFFYVFREGNQAGFYEYFYINPTEKATYQKILGLNFHSEDTFLEGARLKNDYAIVSVALNSDLIYPFIPFMEFYHSRRIRRTSLRAEKIPVEGAGVNPFLFSAGCRYFLSRALYGGASIIITLNQQDEYIQRIIGFDLSVQF